MTYNQLDTEKFIERSRKTHGNVYDYDQVAYVDSKTPVTIKCQTHGYFNQIPSAHIQGLGCRQCGYVKRWADRKTTKEQFVHRSKEKHGDRYDYSNTKFVSLKERVFITCRKHGNFLQMPTDHLAGNGCPECGKEKISLKQSDTFQNFFKKARALKGDLYNYNEKSFVNSSSKVEIECKEHGWFWQRANAHLLGYGCPKCGDVKTSNAKKLTTEEFIRRSKEINGERFNYDKVNYVSGRDKVEIGCYKHGYFFQTPENHLYRKAGCPACNASKGELALEEIFLKHSIKYVREYKIPNIVNRFEYDFYLPDKNTLIEFHGIQHYKPIEYFGGEENFCYVKRNDKLKKHLAKVNNIRILYFDYRQLKRLTKEEFERLALSRIS